MNKLIRTIELLNEKSVVFGIDNSRSNLWILMHFKNLKIASKKIYYQINNGVHQRKNTIHPKRWLKKNSFIEINEDMAKYIEIPDKKKDKYFVKKNDIFICRQNGNLNFVGKVVFILEKMIDLYSLTH